MSARIASTKIRMTLRALAVGAGAGASEALLAPELAPDAASWTPAVCGAPELGTDPTGAGAVSSQAEITATRKTRLTARMSRTARARDRWFDGSTPQP
jgi:hypothetical protein